VPNQWEMTGCVFAAMIVVNQERGIIMQRQTIRVEPLSSYAEARKIPISMAVRSGDFIFVSNIHLTIRPRVRLDASRLKDRPRSCSTR
jgi:hypothetical protein